VLLRAEVVGLKEEAAAKALEKINEELTE